MVDLTITSYLIAAAIAYVLWVIFVVEDSADIDNMVGGLAVSLLWVVTFPMIFAFWLCITITRFILSVAGK